LIFLRVFRSVWSSPINMVTCAIFFELFVLVATTPPPSLVYSGNLFRAVTIAALFAVLPIFTLYLIVKFIKSIFGRTWRQAYFIECALWALGMPILIAIFFIPSRYQDVSARHSLVAKLYAVQPQLHDEVWVKTNSPRLIDWGSQCYPGYSGYQCWLLI